MGWSKPVDIFSAACVIVEIHTGAPIFSDDFIIHADILEKLATIQKVLGTFSYNNARAIEQRRPGTFGHMDPPRVWCPRELSAGSTGRENARISNERIRLNRSLMV